MLDSAKSLVTHFQIKSAKSIEILLKNLLFLTWLKETYDVMQYTNFSIFHLALIFQFHLY